MLSTKRQMNRTQKTSFKKFEGNMSTEQKTAVKTYLESLNQEEFGHLLDEVLTEMRKRASEQIKKDVLSYSLSRRGWKPAG
jgi:hypothetical protein